MLLSTLKVVICVIIKTIISCNGCKIWIPAFAEMTKEGASTTKEGASTTKEGASTTQKELLICIFRFTQQYPPQLAAEVEFPKKSIKLWVIICCLLSMTIVAPVLADNDDDYVMIKNYDLSEADENDYNFNVYHRVDHRHVSIPECKDIPLDYKYCKYALCFEKMPFGKVYRKLSGISDKGCTYVERSEGFGGIDCNIPTENVFTIGQLMEKHYDSITNPEIVLQPDEINDLKNFYASQCKIVEDYSRNKVVTMDNKVYVKDILEELLSLPPSKSGNLVPLEPNAPSSEVAAAPKVTPVPVNNKSAYSLYKSIMFKEEDADKILLAAQNYINPPVERPVASTVTTYKRDAVSTSFYLNSVIYFTSKNWVVWLNNYKFDNYSTTAIVKINEVQPDEVEFVWETKNLDKISPNWRTQLQQINDKLYRSIDRTIQVMLKDAENRYITFRLKPNQTFVVQDLAIVEGKVR